MSSDHRTRLPVQERRSQLLELGRELFGKRPYQEISIDEIARAAGISKGLLYHYFPGKRELYLACVREAVDQMLLAPSVDPDLPAHERLDASLEAFIDYVTNDLGNFKNLLRGGGDTDPEVEGIMVDMHSKLVDSLLADLGICNAGPETRLALLGYTGFASYSAIAWARTRVVDRVTLRRILAGALRGALETAAEVEGNAATSQYMAAVVAVLRK